MRIHLRFSNAAFNNMPQGMVNCIEHAARIYDHMFSGDHVKVNFNVGFNNIDHQHLNVHQGAEGRFNDVVEPYAVVQQALAASDPGLVLPATDPTNGAGIDVSLAEAKALGLIAGHSPEVDGYVGFRYEPYYDTDTFNRAEPDKEDFTGIALHEMSEAMGRRTDPDDGTEANPGGGETILDLTRYVAPGELGVDGGRDYFSTNGGITALKHYDISKLGDFGDWAYPGRGVDAYRGGITPDTLSPITHVDHLLLAGLGFHHG